MPGLLLFLMTIEIKMIAGFKIACYLQAINTQEAVFDCRITNHFITIYGKQLKIYYDLVLTGRLQHSIPL